MFDDKRIGKHAVVHLFGRDILSRCCVFAHMNVLRLYEYALLVSSGLSVVWRSLEEIST